MGILERKERQKKEVRESILQAAWQLVNEEGWQSLSIRKIADAIEYSVPVVYDHFENKEAILFEFTKQGFKLLSDRLSEAKANVAGASAQLEAIAYAYWDFAFENKEYYQVMYGLGMPGCEQIRKMSELMTFTEIIKTTIEQVNTAVGGQPVNSFLKLNSFWSMLHGLVSINIMTAPAAGHGVSTAQMNKMILSDYITGFLKSLQG
jgi:AcrR family transcriptional regulator